METHNTAFSYELETITPESDAGTYGAWHVVTSESLAFKVQPRHGLPPKPPIATPPTAAVEQLEAILTLVRRYESSEQRKHELDTLMFAFVIGFKDAAVRAVENILSDSDSMLLAQIIIALGGVAADAALNSRLSLFKSCLESSNPYIVEASNVALEALEDFKLSG